MFQFERRSWNEVKSMPAKDRIVCRQKFCFLSITELIRLAPWFPHILNTQDLPFIAVWSQGSFCIFHTFGIRFFPYFFQTFSFCCWRKILHCFMHDWDNFTFFLVFHKEKKIWSVCKFCKVFILQTANRLIFKIVPQKKCRSTVVEK